MKVFNKLLAVVVLLAMLTSMLAACGNVCFNHEDADHDGACDKCRTEMEVVHTDENSNGLCDVCQKCIQHKDELHDALCDYCDEEVVPEHVDADNNGLCDVCDVCLEHADKNHDGECDYCQFDYREEHVDANNDKVCDSAECGKCLEHVDANGDNVCDHENCKLNIVPPCDVHTDNNHDGWCDVCHATTTYEHEDAQHDGVCDVCSKKVAVVHEDAQHDGKCDVCDATVRVKHVDEDNDNWCDVCDVWSNAATPNFDLPDGGYDNSKVTITFYNTMGDPLQAVLNKYIPKFRELYPNITIVTHQPGGYDEVRDTIKTELSANAGPNIAYCYPDHVALYNVAHKVVTLDNLINSQVEITRADGSKEIIGLTQAQKDDFIPGYYNEGRAFGDNLMYTMPFSKSTELMYYNEAFFEQHNLKVPDHWWCDDANCETSLENVLKKIKAIDPTSIPLGYDSEANWFITMCEQLGSPYTSATGDNFLFNNDTNKDFVKHFRDWYQSGLMTTQTIYGAYTSGLFTNTDKATQKSYISIGSSGGASHQTPNANTDGSYPFSVGIAPIPQVDPENPKAISQGPSVCIFKKDNQQEVIASWLFVKYLTTNVDFQAEFSIASGYIPVIQSVMENETYAAFIAKENGNEFIAARGVKVALEQANAYYVSPAFNGSSTARDQANALMVKVFTTCLDDASVDKAFADAIINCLASIGK